nr:hypothetical protein [Streptomyces sp. IMTB 2501]
MDAKSAARWWGCASGAMAWTASENEAPEPTPPMMPSHPQRGERARGHGCRRELDELTASGPGAEDQHRGTAIPVDHLADLGAYGQPFICDPVLRARFAAHGPLTEPKQDLRHGPDAPGYADYAPLEG